MPDLQNACCAPPRAQVFVAFALHLRLGSFSSGFKVTSHLQRPKKSFILLFDQNFVSFRVLCKIL